LAQAVQAMVCPTTESFITPLADSVSKGGNHNIDGAYYHAAIAQLEHWDGNRDEQWQRHDQSGDSLYGKLMEERWAQLEAATLSLRAPGESANRLASRIRNSNKSGSRWLRHADGSARDGCTCSSARAVGRSASAHGSGGLRHLSNIAAEGPDAGVRRHIPAVQVLIERQNAAKSVSTQTPGWRPRAHTSQGSTSACPTSSTPTLAGTKALGTRAGAAADPRPPMRGGGGVRRVGTPQQRSRCCSCCGGCITPGTARRSSTAGATRRSTILQRRPRASTPCCSQACLAGRCRTDEDLLHAEPKIKEPAPMETMFLEPRQQLARPPLQPEQLQQPHLQQWRQTPHQPPQQQQQQQQQQREVNYHMQQNIELRQPGEAKRAVLLLDGPSRPEAAAHPPVASVSEIDTTLAMQPSLEPTELPRGPSSIPGLDGATAQLERLVEETHRTLIADGLLQVDDGPIQPLPMAHVAPVPEVPSLDAVDHVLAELRRGLAEIDSALAAGPGWGTDCPFHHGGS